MSLPIEIRRTFPENWPEPLADMSIEGEALAIPDFDARVLGTFSARFITETQLVTNEFFSDDFLANIQTAISNAHSDTSGRLLRQHPVSHSGVSGH